MEINELLIKLVDAVNTLTNVVQDHEDRINRLINIIEEMKGGSLNI